MSSGGPEEVLSKRISVEVDGPVTEAFDSISAQLGISWEYDKTRNRVTFYRLTTETFQVFFFRVSQKRMWVPVAQARVTTR